MRQSHIFYLGEYMNFRCMSMRGMQGACKSSLFAVSLCLCSAFGDTIDDTRVRVGEEKQGRSKQNLDSSPKAQNDSNSQNPDSRDSSANEQELHVEDQTSPQNQDSIQNIDSMIDQLDEEMNKADNANTDNTLKKLDRIVTTTTGFRKDIKDAPASITVVTQEEILTRPIKDLGDAVQDVPGVYVETTKTGQNQIYMRGLRSSYTLILIDGKRQNVNGAFEANGFNGAHTSFLPPLSMIEKIEVIRGPASIIYGADALGGVINIITKKNPKNFTGSVMVETTIQEQRKNWGDSYGVNTYLASPLIKDKLFGNLRASYKYNQENFFYAPSGVKLTNNNPYTSHSPGRWYSWNLGGRLSYEIDSSNVIYFDGEFYHTTNTTLNTSARAISATNDFNKANAILSHDGDYEKAGKVSSYVQYTLTQRIPQMTSGFGNVSGPLNYASLRQNDTIVLSSMYNNDFNLKSWGDIAFTGGIYYLYEKLFIRANHFNRDSHQIAAFAEGQYFIIPSLSATLGVRLNYANLYSARPTPRFYINYNPTNYLTIKAGVANGFLIPNLNQSYDGLYNIDGSGVHQYGFKDLQAEKSWNYELGVILDTNRIYAGLTAFYTDFEDQIQTQTATMGAGLPGGFTCGATTCQFFNNVDRSFLTGFEGTFQANIIDSLTFDASYSFTYTEQLSGINKGLPVNSVPRHKLMLKLSYKYNDFSTFIRMQGNFQTPTLPTNRGLNPRVVLGEFYRDYILLDLALSYRFYKHFSATLSFNNILNTNFIDYRVASNSYINAYQRHLPGRNYWLSIKADW